MVLGDSWLNKDFDGKNKLLGEVLTTKEIEKLYDLPVNTVIQDIRRGKIDYRNVRKSGKIWLVTRGEANKRYSNYEQTRKRK